MRERFKGFVAVAVVFAAGAGIASADYDDRIYDDYSEGCALVSGTEEFHHTDWTVDVDYAVYEPGKYPGDHCDKDTSYIYAYQIFNDSTSNATLSHFSVGLGEDSGAANPRCELNIGDGNEYGEPGGAMPILSQLVGDPPTSVQWIGSGSAPLAWAPGVHSTVLLFSSPYTYTFDSATLSNGGQGDTQSMPSPVPEPAVLILLVGGAVPVLLKRRRKAKV